jgi:AraC-like DNA-binding protein
LKFSEGDFFRVQLAKTGHAVTQIGTRRHDVAPQFGCVSSADAAIEFGEGFVQLAWRVPQSAIRQRLESLSGKAFNGRIELTPVLDLRQPSAQLLRSVLDSLVVARGQNPQNTLLPLLGELEQTAILALIHCNADRFTALFDTPRPTVAPWQVHRAEAYIEAHWDRSLSIEDLVAATGTSARSLFRTFRQYRGYSPWQFVKQVRLNYAYRRLAEGHPQDTVTEIALSCGWGDVGQFSKDFLARFGCSPSALLRRGKAIGASPHIG